MSELDQIFFDHVEVLTGMSERGDEVATRSLAAMALLANGWRPGDPDPDRGPDDDGGEPNVIPLGTHPLTLIRRAVA